MAVVCLAFCSFLVVAWRLIVGNEPSYEGRSLTAWLRDLDSSPWDNDSQACQAIRAMGTNTIPFLVNDIVAKDPDWRTALRNRFRASRFAWLRGSPAQVARGRAAKALRALGANAAPALPLLIEEVRRGEGKSGLPWVGILAIVQSLPETVPMIIKELDASPYRSQAAYFLGICATNAPVTVPFLIRCAQDEHWQTRYHALMGLERFGPCAVEAEPIIRELLNDTNPFVANQAAAALEAVAGIGE